MCQTVVVGCGSLLLADSGVGICSARQLRLQPLPGGVVVYEDHNQDGTVLDLILGARRAVLIAPTLSDKRPGTVRRFHRSDPESWKALFRAIHGVGLADALKLGELTRPEGLPADMVVVGVEIKDASTYHVGLSDEVEAALPNVIKQVMKELATKEVPAQVG